MQRYRRELFLDCQINIPRVFAESTLMNPMLLAFTCILAKHSRLNVEKRTEFTLCEIYLQLTKFLLKTKSNNDFVDRTLRAGREAFESIKIGKFSSELCKGGTQLGPFCARNPRPYPSFPEITLQIFLGALYFVVLLGYGRGIQYLLGSDPTTAIFAQNSLFLYFCFELLHKQKFSCFLNRKRRTTAFGKIAKYFLRRMNVFQLDVADFFAAYPALLDLAYRENDAKVQSFLVKILSKCNETKMLYLTPSHPIDLFLKYLNLSSIYLSNGDTSIDFEAIAQSTSDELKIVLINQEEMHIPKLVTYANTMGKNYSFYFIGKDRSEKTLDICQFLSSNVRKIYLWQKSYECTVEVDGKIPKCLNLTHLLLNHLRFQKESLKTLADAIDEGKFPVLSYLSICPVLQQSNICGIMFKLPSLKHLEITQGIQQSDLNALTQQVLPRLELLSIDSWLNPDPNQHALKNILTNLRTFKQQGRVGGIFTDALKAGLFPNLSELKLVESSADLTQVLTSEKLPKLTSLTIQKHSNFDNLSKGDLISQLHTLDLTSCKLSSKMSDLLHKELPALVTLILTDSGL